MEKWIKCGAFFFIGVAVLTFSGCGGGASTGTGVPPPPTPDEWVWESGSTAVDQGGYYGSLGTASTGTTPGARSYPVGSTDSSGNLWLFSGYGYDSTDTLGDLNDLWQYSNGKWTWVSGSSLVEQPGTYGTQGTAASGNVPGARYQAVSWTDSSGNLWVFGGLGIDSAGTRGRLDDLWKYSAGMWTWMGGSKIVADYVPGVYGAEGTAAPGNLPGARVDAVSWTDPAGNLWLFGGLGYDSTGTLGVLNDLWKYSAGEWAWMGGANIVGALGTYGTQGVAAPANTPGSRTNAVTWTDAAGDLWLFGGEGNDSNGVLCAEYSGFCPLNDLWKYSAGEWTWMGGSNLADESGTYGTQGTAAPSNVPGGRLGAVGWTDASGNFWLFGGYGFDSSPSPASVFGDLNDLWKYSGGEWTWMGGSSLAGQLGTYGALGVAAAGNTPGGLSSAVGWIDPSGNLWLFGGSDVDSIAHGGPFNDLWKYQP